MSEPMHPAIRPLAFVFDVVRHHPLPKLLRNADNQVYPFITRNTREGLYGYIEDIGPTGIRGWLLDCAARDTHLKVDAYLDGQLLGRGLSPTGSDLTQPEFTRLKCFVVGSLANSGGS